MFAERKVLRLLGAGCTAAVGVYAKEENGTFWMGLMRETKRTYPQEDLRSAGGFHETRGASRKEGDRRGASRQGKLILWEQAPETADLSR